MADPQQTSYLSIGEVLGLLLEEFPDVTISKIRFLESQGLISPERTSSGYRKFYDDDVQLLRVILSEQRENYLPLRVIKDRLDSGEIDPTGEHLRPNGDGELDDDGDGDVAGADGTGTTVESTSEREDDTAADGHDADEDGAPPVSVPPASIASHPAARGQAPTPPRAGTEPNRSAADSQPDEPDERSAATQLLPGVLLDRAELCAMVGMTDDELDQLESFGVVTPRDSSGIAVYGEDAVEIARPACEFLRSGVDARHLRNWRTSADREASLFEQLVAPRFRQRNPEARAEALEQLRRLDQLGAQLRSALTRHALRHHFDV
jgi:DNA-binding transcriptional MerR regulator